MIIPTCHGKTQDDSGLHHPYCPTVAEPQPLNDTQITAENSYVENYVSTVAARDIVFRKDVDGSPLFPNLALTSTQTDAPVGPPRPTIGQNARDNRCTTVRA